MRQYSNSCVSNLINDDDFLLGAHQLQQVRLNGRCSSYLYNDAGVLQGAVLSPFLFSLHTYYLSSCHSILLKYVDNFVPGNSYSKCSGQEGLDDDLSHLVTWGADHGLIIKKDQMR